MSVCVMWLVVGCRWGWGPAVPSPELWARWFWYASGQERGCRVRVEDRAWQGTWVSDDAGLWAHNAGCRPPCRAGRAAAAGLKGGFTCTCLCPTQPSPPPPTPKPAPAPPYGAVVPSLNRLWPTGKGNTSMSMQAAFVRNKSGGGGEHQVDWVGGGGGWGACNNTA